MGKDRNKQLLFIVVLALVVFFVTSNVDITGNLITKKRGTLLYPIYSGDSGGRSTVQEGGLQQQEECHKHKCVIPECPPFYYEMSNTCKMDPKTDRCEGVVVCQLLKNTEGDRIHLPDKKYWHGPIYNIECQRACVWSK